MTAIDGFGLGLRTEHYTDFRTGQPAVDWLGNHFRELHGAYRPLQHLDAIRAHYPMVMHGVSLSIGSTDPEHAISGRPESADRPRAARLDLRPHLLDRRGPRQPARPAAHALHRSRAQAHGRTRAAGAGSSQASASRWRNVSTYVAFAGDDMNEWGVRQRTRRARRPLAAARREQCLRERPQPWLRRSPLHRRPCPANASARSTSPATKTRATISSTPTTTRSALASSNLRPHAGTPRLDTDDDRTRRPHPAASRTAGRTRPGTHHCRCRTNAALRAGCRTEAA